MDTYRNNINDQILSLSYEKKIVFALLICERLFPNYKFFSNKNNYGNPELLKFTVDDLYYNLLSNNKLSNYDTESIIEKVEQITPDTGDYDTILVSFALDACTSVLSTLYFINDRNIENIIDVATYARDTVDMYIQERDNLGTKNIDSIIEQDVLMRKEKQRQMAVISLLHNMETINPDQITALRNLSDGPIINLEIFN